MIRISDHVLLRYLERTGKVDVAALRVDLERRAGRAVAKAEHLRAEEGRYAVLLDGVRIVFEGNVATTTLTSRMPPKLKRRRRDDD